MFINATPHDINFFDADSFVYDSAQRKNIVVDGAKPSTTIVKSGKLLNCKTSVVDVDTVNNIKIQNQIFDSVDNPSDIFDNITKDTIIIVSQFFLAAYRAVNPGCNKYKFATIGSPVYTNQNDPRPIGCSSLII